MRSALSGTSGQPLAKRALAAALGLALVAAAGCATRSDFDTYYFAEQGQLDEALGAAEDARGGGIDGFFFGTGASECRDYSAVVTVLVAKGDFAGARQACSAYDDQCAVIPGNTLCFSYDVSELDAAGSDTDLAESLSSYARETLHYRWLMIQDDYEGRPIRRPIY